MEIKSVDTKQLSIDTEKGSIILFLPIGTELEVAKNAAASFYSAFEQALKLVEEKKEQEKKEKVDDISE